MTPAEATTAAPPKASKKAAKPQAVPASTVKQKSTAAKPATVPRPPTPGGGPSKPSGDGARRLDPYTIILHPIVTEKTMFNMDRNNSLEFLVSLHANKPSIAKAIEDLFAVKVQKVTTRISKDGKRAIVRFAEGYSAEDIGMRIGVF